MFNVCVSLSKHAVSKGVCKNFPKLIYSRNLCILRSYKNNGLKSSDVCPAFQDRIYQPNYYVHSLYSNKPDTHIKTTDEPVVKNSNELYNEVDYNAITNGDEGALKKLKILMLEVEVMKQEGFKVPSKLSTNEWKELLTFDTRSKRRKFLGFVWLNEIKAQCDKQKKEKRRQQISEKKELEQKENEEHNHITYGFQGVTIFLRIYETTMNVFYNNRLIQAMQFGQKLVIDCGYDEYMTNMEAKNCGKQMMLMFADNRMHNDPYDLYFCNADPNFRSVEQLHKYIPTLNDPEFPANVTEKSYLDLFPKEKLVYLTPHCREELTVYDHDAIYIIGSMVDKTNKDPLSLAKAKSEGLKMACFPLDRYLDWQIGGKSLTLNQSLCIMLDMKCTGKWTEALKHVPRRKLMNRDDNSKFFKQFNHRQRESKFPPLLDRH